jgi:hypothetical protein
MSFQLPHRSIDCIERRANCVGPGGSLTLKFKDLKLIGMDIASNEDFANVADSLEKLCAIGEAPSSPRKLQDVAARAHFIFGSGLNK